MASCMFTIKKRMGTQLGNAFNKSYSPTPNIWRCKGLRHSYSLKFDLLSVGFEGTEEQC